MRRRFSRPGSWVAALVVTIAPAALRAEGPAFDCSKAQGEVEPLICKDAELAALDRRLDGVYKEALGKARDGMDKSLRTEQRGWVGGRNECWKAKGDARLERGDQTVTVWLVPTGSGSRYEGRNVTFWSKGDEAMVTWLGSDLKCRARPGL